MTSLDLSEPTPALGPAARAPAATNSGIADRLFDASGALGAALLLSMTAMVCWEIAARFLFNRPTSWVTEISPYLLVAIVFIGLAVTERRNGHIQVELLVTALSPSRQHRLDLLAHWIGLLFLLAAAWQMTLFNHSEYVHDSRDWGLLSTPQWIPQLPVTLGLWAAAAASLCNVWRMDGPARRRRWGLPALAGVVALAFTWLPARGAAGAAGGLVPLAVALLLSLAVVLISGWRIAAAVGAVMGSVALAFWLARGGGAGPAGLALAAALFLLLLLGVRIAHALGLTGLLGLVLLLPSPQLSVLAERCWSSVNSSSLTAVPMFVLMGALLLRSGVTVGMFDALTRWFGRTPGGLAHASVGASAIFAAVSGSSLATAATLGTVACPEMTRRGYSPRLAYGVVAAGATLGILIPPSIPMIIYGATVGASVTQLFIAGIIPGLLLAAVFGLVALGWSLACPSAAPRGPRFSLREKVAGSTGMLPFCAVIGAVLGCLYAGIATPTEAAAIGVLAAAGLCALRGQVSRAMLLEVALETAKVTSLLLFIVVGASVLSWVFDFLRLPQALAGAVGTAALQPWAVMVVMVLIYVLLGMFIDSISMMLVTIPVTFPLVTMLGFDAIWFGIFLVLMIELGLITPPVGMVLFVLRGLNRAVSFKDIVLGVLPFVAAMLAFVALIYAVPQIVTWLPARIDD
jgi:tripartite ATP-independent transporter DctM subunit